MASEHQNNSMHEYQKQSVSADTENMPRSEVFSDKVEQEKGNEDDDLTRLQEKGATLLEKIIPNGESHLEKIGLENSLEAQEITGEYNARREDLRAKIREKMALAATVGMLAMGSGNALSSALESTEKNSQSLPAELSISSKDIISEEEPLLKKEEVSTISTENIQAGGIETKKETEPVSPEAPESSDEKELREMTEMASRIANACLGLEKDGCLTTILNQPTAKDMMMDATIPFRKGLKEIGSALGEEKMKDGERFGKAIKGIFDLITDAALLHVGGKQVIQLAQLYRVYEGVGDIQSAHSFYMENKKEIDEVLARVFKDSPEKKQAVEATLATLEKVEEIHEVPDTTIE